MAFDAHSSARDIPSANLQDISHLIENPNGTVSGRADYRPAGGAPTPLTAAESTLQSAIAATQREGGIPGEDAINLFYSAVVQSQQTAKAALDFMKQPDNHRTAQNYVDGQRDLASAFNQLDPLEAEDMQKSIKAYLDGLVDKTKFEDVIAKKYPQIPELLSGMREMYDAQHAPNFDAVMAVFQAGNLAGKDRLLTSAMYTAALDAQAEHKQLGSQGR